MSSEQRPSPKSILRSILLASRTDIEGLQLNFSDLAWSGNAELALTILLRFLPETASPALYLDLAYLLCQEGQWLSFADLKNETKVWEEILELDLLDDQSAENILAGFFASSSSASAQANFSITKPHDAESTFAEWIFARIEILDSSVGIFNLIHELVSQHHDLPSKIIQWRTGVLEPVERFNMYYPDNESFNHLFQLSQIVNPDQSSAIITFLLQHSTSRTITRDVGTIVTPYLNYIDTVSSSDAKVAWPTFFNWLVSASNGEKFGAVVELAKNWDGPAASNDLTLQYVSSLLAFCYIYPIANAEVFESMHTIQKRALYILNASSDNEQFSNAAIETQLSDVLETCAFDFPNSPLFLATKSNLDLFDVLVTAAALISVYIPTTLQSIAQLRFYGTAADQLAFISKVVRGKSKEYAYRDDSNWRTLRSGARWLRNKSLVLQKLTESEIESVFVSALLDFGRIGLVQEIYIDPIYSPIETSHLEQHILNSFQNHYDNASNCNATRGSLKTASQILALIYPKLSNSEPLMRADLLLKATHELSKYSLTLVHGVPLQPLQIKLNGNPEEIISQLLQSNQKAYIQPDDLITMTKNLHVGLDMPVAELQGVEYRIIRMSVYAALAADDFTTAFEYCMSRLWDHRDAIAQLDRDLVWQVFYAAGRYVSPNASSTPSPGPNAQSPMAMLLINNRVKHLRLQMRLLSLALDICPEVNMLEILTVWQEFELQIIQCLAK
ncbi:Sec39 domain-containing protein [Lipomyces japonicus]|uniref:Sec39 domain-containing protein n=1 Tax=Lipomyces japonicus TaxID=56871 RepID=UPI0034CE6C4F